LQRVIANYLHSGGNLFVSGAYLGTDMFINPVDSDDVSFCTDILKYKLASDHAVITGGVESVDSNFIFKNGLNFNTEYSEKIYKVEAPDALKPVNGSKPLFRYSENYFCAGIGYNAEYGIVAVGFPFETIRREKNRNLLMKTVIEYFKK
jgi:hypothetical protein